VIFETTPTYANLFGTMQRAYDARGGWTSDFMDLRGGSLLRADGGFLIMYSIEALSELGVWRALKRTLNHTRLEIQPLEVFYPFATTALKPEPVELNVKVILIGDRDLYELLYEYEEDFRKIFKVRVEFDEEMPLSDGVIEEYAGRLRGLSEKENLFPFDRGAFAAILEYGVRKAGRRNKVTARFVDIADLAREAHYTAAAAGENVVRAAHVRSGNDRRGHAAGGLDGNMRRPGEWVERDGDRGVCVRKAGAHHGERGAGQGGTHQYRARSESQRKVPRQGRAHHRGVFAQLLCEGQAAVTGGEHLLRAIVFGRRWG
jgi:predicted ATP-dependent protease